MIILELTSYVILFFLLPLLLFTIRNQTWFSKQRLPPSPQALPIIGHLHLLGPLIHHSFNDLSSKQGPLLYLRLGSIPCIMASTPELAKELLKANDLAFSAHPNSLALDHLTYNSVFAFAPNGPYWKFIKRLITTEHLGNRTLNQFLPIRTKELHLFIRYLVNKGEADSLAENARGLAREVTKIFGQFNRIEDVHKRYDALIEKIITDHEELRKRKETRKITCYRGEHDVKNILDILLDAFVRTYVIECHKGQHFQLLPFGTGSRGCPGLSLAMQERVISLSGVETNVVDMTESPGLTNPRANDLVCVLVP
ncbi:hypothetical protein ACB092_08G047100 [Castanea dentata]